MCTRLLAIHKTTDENHTKLLSHVIGKSRVKCRISRGFLFVVYAVQRRLFTKIEPEAGRNNQILLLLLLSLPRCVKLGSTYHRTKQPILVEFTYVRGKITFKGRKIIVSASKLL